MERIVRAAAVFGLRPDLHRSRLGRSVLACLVALAALLQSAVAGAAGSLTASSVALTDPRPGVASNYSFTGSSVDTGTAILCVKVVWSTTASGDTAPTGFDGSGGTVDASSSSLINNSATNWSLARFDGTASSGQKNVWQYTNSASGVTPSSASSRTFVLTGLVNSSTVDTAFYFKINTYGNTNCSSSPIDNATVAFINTNGSTLSLTINPTLTFSVNAIGASQSCDGTTTTAASTATTIPFGTVTAASNGVVCQDLQAATNATGGYTIYLRYTGPPTSGGNTIADFTGTNSVPAAFSAAGTEAYGYATDDSSLSNCGGSCNADRFTNPSQGWAAATTSNAEVGYEPAGASTTHYHIGHQVGAATTTQAGNYSTTIIYACTPVY